MTLVDRDRVIEIIDNYIDSCIEYSIDYEQLEFIRKMILQYCKVINENNKGDKNEQRN